MVSLTRLCPGIPPDIALTFGHFYDISRTPVKFSDISLFSRLSRVVVTVYIFVQFHSSIPTHSLSTSSYFPTIPDPALSKSPHLYHFIHPFISYPRNTIQVFPSELVYCLVNFTSVVNKMNKNYIVGIRCKVFCI